MPLQPKKAVAGLKNSVHGGYNYAELEKLGIDTDSLLDFSVSTNPFMPPPDIQQIMASASISRYPDSQSTRLRNRLAEKLGIGRENILAGSGSTELIRLIVLAYIKPGDAALIVGPTYGEYETTCRLYGARPLQYLTSEENGFTPDINGLLAVIAKKHPKAVFLCNPNNPTGKYLSQKDVAAIAAAMKDTLLILDEAYAPFVKKRWDALKLMGQGSIIVLRSMTKDYGIPGLRLGYVVACREIIDVLRLAAPPWNVNAIAQEAGFHLLANDKYLKESLRQTHEAATFLKAELARIGFEVRPSATHYFLVKVDNAAAFRLSLLKKRIMVRDGTSFGLPQFIRISARPLPDCRKLVSAFKDLK